MQKIKKSITFFAVFIISLSFVITAKAADSLVPVGHTAGIKLLSDGAIVTELTDELADNPCRAAGIAPGDVVKSADGVSIHSNEDLKRIVTGCEGREITLVYERNGEEKSAKLTPVKSSEGEYVVGVRIRDSVAGIGTLTYYDPESKTYGALGHGISESDTNVLIPAQRGALMKAKVESVVKGAPGKPGELRGEYDMTYDFADITKNTESGIFGTVKDSAELSGMAAYPVASKNEIKRGKATILSNIEGDEVKEYEIEITSIYFDGEKTKNMLVRATDPELISKTGGIVRGMSGSPIIQNGKIVGAITHVLVNNPQKGYAIFIENMLDAAA
ncbi:MAG: SpoIVB peptidase [Oscillospiraceae bacterium]|nr:SpoIVB peptidase [Oscillospiraceae bacterium]